MAGVNSGEVVVGGNGAVYVAPVQLVAALPTNVDSVLAAAYVNVGFTSEDGVDFTDGKTIEDIKAWQSPYPIRKLVTEKASALEFVLKQWNADTIPVAFGGAGTVVKAGGYYRYLPPAPEVITFQTVVIDWQDGTDKFRLVMPRCQVTGEVSSKIARTSSADLPIHLDATPSGAPSASDLSTQPWYFMTDKFLTT